MRIVWNAQEKYFQAEFAKGEEWAADQFAAKEAGFKTTGPPDWVWYAPGVKPLLKLRKKRPVSGLTISDVASAEFSRLDAEHTANERIKKQLKDALKAIKDKREIHFDGTPFDWDAPQVPPPAPPGLEIPHHKIKPLEGKACISCGEVVAFYERQIPPVCLWCEKTVFEKST